ncbi:hypothetical protein C6497_13110 [Candidatus Poribacteria bacterium]|nr:MAG: hypothetical protein C6497_13110 [Candidatus Poribacteria bacterium]
MKNDDVELIQLFLAGDEPAFTELVKKYQKPVHALAWRKIADFHIAEDLTQDTFLKVYQKLHTLKDPNQFSGWLYVITTNLCATWLRRNRKRKEQLEKAEITMTQRDTYSQYVRDDRANSVTQTQREVVKKLLGKLKESERTVMTLHYLGEMKIEEISKFLGVSVSTIKTRLMRARQRLRKEETMIREALEHFQISPNLTDNIMQEVARLKPTPSGSKPLIPWAVAASTAVLIALMLGIGNQHLARFQTPYSLDVQSELAVELVEAHIVQDSIVEPDFRNQMGSANAIGKSDTPRQKPNEVLFAAAEANGEVKNISNRQQEWIQSTPMSGSSTQELLATSEGDLYSYTTGHLYKLPANGIVWEHLFEIWTLDHTHLNNHVLAEWNKTLYYTQSSRLFASIDDGKTWNLVYSWEDIHTNPIAMILTDHEFYIAFDNGIFSSNDYGKTWKHISMVFDGSINALVKVQNTLLVGTDKGLYRMDTEGWKHLKFPEPIDSVYSVAATEKMIYILASLKRAAHNPDKVSRGHERGWALFGSSNLGNRWLDITPINAWAVNGFIPEAKLIATGDTILLMERGMVRSTDRGLTWLAPQLSDTTPFIDSYSTAAVVNSDTIYVCRDGLHRSTDYGKSWETVNITPDNIDDGISNLIVISGSEKDKNNRPFLYGIFELEGIKTTDRGKSWKDVPVEISMSKPFRENSPNINQIIKSGDILYASVDYRLSGKKTCLYKLSSNGSRFLPIQDMPIFDTGKLEHELERNLSIDHLRTQFLGASQFFKQLVNGNAQQQQKLLRLGLEGVFTVSGDTFYMEYNFKLFRWKMGDTEWYDTGVEETVELSGSNLKLAALGNTVYVGKRDGKLMASFDKGTNWIDFTSALPFPVNDYKQILVAGTTVYVATDAGIITSGDGKRWNTITDAAGDNLIMEHLANDGNTLYGVKDTGIYRLENGIWQQIVSVIPNNVTSLAVDENTLYVGTQSNGMLHYTLE